MSDNPLRLIEELRKLERKKKSLGGKLPDDDERKLAGIKHSLSRNLLGHKLSSDRRSELRVPVSMRVRYHSGDTFAHNYISNLSGGGVFISTPRPLPLDTRVKLILVFEDKNTEIEVQGKVVWENTQGGRRDDITKPGMGIKFTRVEGEAQQVINDMIHDVLEERARNEAEQTKPKSTGNKSAKPGKKGFSLFRKKK